ncbi:hypothetical protein ACVU7I_01790 [Patulibacter sp. S7RM1-6]
MNRLTIATTAAVTAFAFPGCGSSSDGDAVTKQKAEIASLREQVVAAETKVDKQHESNAKLVTFFTEMNKFGNDLAEAESACVGPENDLDAYGPEGVCGLLERADRRLRTAAKKLGTPDLPTE